ncbi:MAG: histidine phosphatase family protein [Bacteroidetes bacterium]|nr:histidine phosphatase family protein [Bacteroidota bacterium]
MKTLYLIRHAKASWEMPGVSDADRPLIPKGVKKTMLVLDFLQKRETKIDLIISSPAVRAYETAQIIAAGLDYPISKIKTDRKIYDGYYDRILDIVYGAANNLNSLMIFGHNPTITNLANLFLHPGIDNMPTSCVVCLSFDTEKWEHIPSVEAKQEFVVFPKMLK